MRRKWRSLLFVAADDQARLAKIAGRGADAVILDLEDAVPPVRKASAREGLSAAISTLSAGSCALVVRINSAWRDVAADLEVAVVPGVAAIMVPKVEDGAQLRIIGEMIAEYAAAAGMDKTPAIIALVESPAGIAALGEIAAQDDVVGLALGSEDFSLSLGVAPTPEALDLPCRLLALAAAQRGLMALGLPVSIATIKDVDAWAAAIFKARSIGITGALCIHPAQVGPVNDGFGASAEEVENARRVIAAWDASGGNGVIQLDGKMVDLPVVLAARRTLESA